MKELLEDAAKRAIAYLQGLDSRSVAPTPEAIDRLKLLDERLPEEPSDPASTLKMLDSVCMKKRTHETRQQLIVVQFDCYQRNLHFLRRQPAVMAAEILLELFFFIPPNRLVTIGQDN